MNVTKDVLSIELLLTRYLYLPVLGKCRFNHSFDLSEGTKFTASAQPLRIERKDEEGTRYNISEYIDVEIDFDAMKMQTTFRKYWIGGLVEAEAIKCDFELTGYNKEPADVEEAVGYTVATSDITGDGIIKQKGAN